MTRRTTTNFVVDIVAFAAFVLLSATGLVERYVLPPGTGRFQSLWGMNRHQWGEMHFWIAMVLMAILSCHILLHWKWIVHVLRGRETRTSGWRFAFGLVGIVGLVGLSLAPFLATVEQTGEPGRGRQHERGQSETTGQFVPAQGVEIRGSMTLAELEAATGVSAKVIVDELGLPPDVSREEQLGRLRRQFDFEMDDVREIVGQE